MKYQDLTGQTFGEWTVLERDFSKKSTYFICKCSCGTVKSVAAYSLKNGDSKSCGCKRPEFVSNYLKKDLIGQTFGRLTVVESLGLIDHNMHWRCVCQCGGEKIATTDSLSSGKTRSCGCFQKDQARKAQLKHGLSHTRLSNTYYGMIARCYNPKSASYPLYGGRGIEVCDEWRENPSEFFKWALETGYSDDLTIDRIDSNGNYCPENCRWSTCQEQSNNTRRNVRLEYNGEIHTIAEWSRILGVSRIALYCRYERGWDVNDIFTKPFRTRR